MHAPGSQIGIDWEGKIQRSKISYYNPLRQNIALMPRFSHFQVSQEGRPWRRASPHHLRVRFFSQQLYINILQICMSNGGGQYFRPKIRFHPSCFSEFSACTYCTNVTVFLPLAWSYYLRLLSQFPFTSLPLFPLHYHAPPPHCIGWYIPRKGRCTVFSKTLRSVLWN